MIPSLMPKEILFLSAVVLYASMMGCEAGEVVVETDEAYQQRIQTRSMGLNIGKKIQNLPMNASSTGPLTDKLGKLSGQFSFGLKTLTPISIDQFNALNWLRYFDQNTSRQYISFTINGMEYKFFLIDNSGSNASIHNQIWAVGRYPAGATTFTAVQLTDFLYPGPMRIDQSAIDIQRGYLYYFTHSSYSQGNKYPNKYLSSHWKDVRPYFYIMAVDAKNLLIDVLTNQSNFNPRNYFVEIAKVDELLRQEYTFAHPKEDGSVYRNFIGEGVAYDENRRRLYYAASNRLNPSETPRGCRLYSVNLAGSINFFTSGIDHKSKTRILDENDYTGDQIGISHLAVNPWNTDLLMIHNLAGEHNYIPGGPSALTMFDFSGNPFNLKVTHLNLPNHQAYKSRDRAFTHASFVSKNGLLAFYNPRDGQPDRTVYLDHSYGGSYPAYLADEGEVDRAVFIDRKTAVSLDTPTHGSMSPYGKFVITDNRSKNKLSLYFQIDQELSCFDLVNNINPVMDPHPVFIDNHTLLYNHGIGASQTEVRMITIPDALTSLDLIPFGTYYIEWKPVTGKARDIGVGGNSVYMIGKDETHPDYGSPIYRWNGSGWNIVSGLAVAVSVGPDGLPWVVNKEGKIYQFVSGQGWVERPGTDGQGMRARDIGIGGNGSVFIVEKQVTHPSYGSRILYWTGNRWEERPGLAVKIDVDNQGFPWVVNQQGKLYQWTGSGWLEHTQVMGKSLRARDVGVSATNTPTWGRFVTSAENFEEGGYAYFSNQHLSWRFMDPVPKGGDGLGVVVDVDGSDVWLVAENGSIYRAIWLENP